MWIALILIATTIGLLFKWLRRPFDHWHKLGVKQTNPTIFFGDCFKIANREFSRADFFKYIYNLFPNERYSGFYEFTVPNLLIRDPDLIKQIFVKDFDSFADHHKIFYDDPSSLFSRSLVSLTGKEWHDTRALLTPSFTSSKMKFLFGLVQKTAQNFVDHFKNLDNQRNDVEIELVETFGKFKNDATASVVFGVEVDSLKDPENPFYVLSKEAGYFEGFGKISKVFFPKIYKMLNISFYSKALNDFFFKLVRDSVEFREANKIVRPDMLHLLMQARKGDQTDLTSTNGDSRNRSSKKQLSEHDLAAQTMMFYFGGLESVTGFMSFVGYELAANPDIQNRLRSEIHEALKTCDGSLTYDVLVKMKYLDMVLSETLRKWPNVVAIKRECTRPYTIKASLKSEVDIRLPLGSLVCLSVFGLHRDPEYFPDPEKFDPERFSDENKHKIYPYAYLPFGVGPRNCIGSKMAIMETKILMVNLLRDFEIVPCSRSRIPLQLCTKSFFLVAKDKFWFKLRRLENCTI